VPARWFNKSKYLLNHMANKSRAFGLVHKMPSDLQKVIDFDSAAQAEWKKITPLARNEWICWIISAKKLETRAHRIRRTVAEIKKGIRRPCCWMGCIHRKDKKLSPSQKFMLSRQYKKTA